MGDPINVHQILMNLATNASHAMKNGGILEIRLSEERIDAVTHGKIGKLESGNYLRVSVCDTGAGIEPDIVNSIFDPYFTTKEGGEGTGMGLSVVYGIVKKYHGEIVVESQPGQGSLFSIYFPITQRCEMEELYQEEALPRGEERILLVDDEPAIANMVSRSLEKQGFTVTIRTSSIEALALFDSKPEAFDLVITDMTMPNMTGDILAKEMFKIRPDVPIILCTGYSKNISNETALAMGIKAFAYKPIVNADLLKTLRKVLDAEAGSS